MESITNSAAYEAAKPILEAVAIVIIGWIIIKILTNALVKVLNKTKLDPMLHKFIGHAATIGMWVVVLLSAMEKLGINSSSVITVLAACGAAVALALQNSLSNLAGGILIMFSHNFSSGDYIIACGQEGTVESIDLLQTTIITPDNKTVSIPNGSLTAGTIANATKKGTRRVDMEVGISYESDFEQAKDILVNLAKENPLVLQDPAPFVAVSEYADSAVVLVYRVWCKASDYWDVKFGLQNQTKAAFDAKGISIPFNQLDVHVTNEK